MKILQISFLLQYLPQMLMHTNPVSGSFLLNTLFAIFFVIINFFNKIFIKILVVFFCYKQYKENYNYIFHIETISFLLFC